MTDKEIKAGLLQNDHATIRYVYTTLAPSVIKHVLNNKGSRDDGKDLFQETFIRVMDNLQRNQYQEQGKFEAYFVQIARNLWIDHLRKHKKRQLIQESEDVLLQLADDNDEDARYHLIQHDQKLEHLMHVWQQWNDTECQRRLQAFHFEKASTQQLAQSENVALGTLLKRLYDCRKKLFKLVQHRLTV